MSELTVANCLRHSCPVYGQKEKIHILLPKIVVESMSNELMIEKLIFSVRRKEKYFRNMMNAQTVHSPRLKGTQFIQSFIHSFISFYFTKYDFCKFYLQNIRIE